MSSTRSSRWLVKPALLLGCAAAVGVAATGCGSASSGSSGSTSSTAPKADLAVGKTGPRSAFVSIKPFCPAKQMTVAYADGAGAGPWRKISRKEFEEEAAQCPNLKTIYTDGQGDPQTQISNVQSLISRRVGAIVSYPDAGPAMLPVYAQAMRADIPVVLPWVGTDFGGQAGQNWSDIETNDITGSGAIYADWMIKALKGKGNVIILGGTPGNPNTAAVFKGAKAELAAKAPGIKLVVDHQVYMNFDEAQTQKAVAGVLSSHPDLNGIISQCGGCNPGAIRAFQQAGVKLPAITGDDINQMGCLYEKLKAKNPTFQMATTSGRTWLIRPALRKALAAAQGKSDTEPSTVDLGLEEDSLDPSKQPKCDKTLPPGAVLSSSLSKSTLTSLLG